MYVQTVDRVQRQFVSSVYFICNRVLCKCLQLSVLVGERERNRLCDLTLRNMGVDGFEDPRLANLFVRCR